MIKATTSDTRNDLPRNLSRARAKAAMLFTAIPPATMLPTMRTVLKRKRAKGVPPRTSPESTAA